MSISLNLNNNLKSPYFYFGTAIVATVAIGILSLIAQKYAIPGLQQIGTIGGSLLIVLPILISLCVYKYDQVERLDHNEVIRLADLGSITEEDWELMGKIPPDDQRRIDEILSETVVQKLMAQIKETKREPKPNYFNEYLRLLHVVCGIKPCFVVERGFDDFLVQILKDLSQRFPSIEYSDNHYIVNNECQDQFQPHQYINSKLLSGNLVDCLKKTFDPGNDIDKESRPQMAINQGRPENCQTLSYLLGFGPSWEAFVIHDDPQDDDGSRFFNNLHYEQLGIALKGKNPLKAGKYYSLHIRQIFPSKTFRLNEQRLYCIGILTVLDGIAIRTPYFQASYCQKKYIYDQIFKDSQNK